MLGKLFKYENRAVSKILLPLSLAVIVLSIFAALMLKLNLIFEGKFTEGSIISMALSTTTGMMTIFSIIAMISADFIALYMIMQRYYKNLFTDEGYLTFTLPVKTSSIILSKLFCAVIWSVIVAISTIIGIFIFAIFGTSVSFVNVDAIKGTWEILCQLFEFYYTGDFEQIVFLIELLISAVVSLFTNFLLIYLSITLGCQIAKKHKILASIGMYFVVSAIVSTLGTVVQIITSGVYGGLDYLDTITSISDVYLMLIPSIILSVVLGVGYFFLNHYILKNRLNIE